MRGGAFCFCFRCLRRGEAFMEEQDLRRISETAYLNAENAARYRAILHFCYCRHEHMQTFVYPDEIYRELAQTSFLLPIRRSSSRRISRSWSHGGISRRSRRSRRRAISRSSSARSSAISVPRIRWRSSARWSASGGAGGFIRRFAGDDAVRPVALASFLAAARVRGADG